MSSPVTEMKEITTIIPYKTMRSNTGNVNGVVHLPSGRRIITCSTDGSLRLWGLESGTQIGDDWRDEGNKVRMFSIALSPNGSTIASGSGNNGAVRLWDVEKAKVIVVWKWHMLSVDSVCWSASGDRVLSVSEDGARIWDVKSGKTVLGPIKTRQTWVDTVIFSPDSTKFATGGLQDGIKIWDAKTGALLTIIRHDHWVRSLAWNGEKLISASNSLIRIFDTATWQQIATLQGHRDWVNAITCSQNGHLLVSVSNDQTARLWNLDTNLQVGPPLQHDKRVECAALSADGTVLVTGSGTDVYAWDIHAILKKAGLEDLLIIASQGEPERTPRSSISDKSLLEADATRCHDEFWGFDGLSPRFFDGTEAGDGSSSTDGGHPHSSASALLARLASLLRRFRPNNAELPQTPTPSLLHPRVLLDHLSLLFHHSPPYNDGENEPQPCTPSGLDLHALFARLSSLLPRSQPDSRTGPHPTTPLSSRPFVDVLSSFFRSQPRTSEVIELSQRTTTPHVVEIPAMRDREVLFVAPPPLPHRPNTQPNGTTTPGGRPAYSLPVRMLAHLVLFLCCASPRHPDGNAPSTQQQQGQSQGPVQTQTSPPQTQPVTLLVSTSAVPTAPIAHARPTRATTL